MPPYQNGISQLLSQPFSDTSAPLQMLLVTTGYTYDADHDTVDDGTTSDPKSYEIGVSGYARQDLSSLAAFVDDTGDFAGLDAGNVTFSSLGAGATIGHAIVYRYSTSGGTTSDTGQILVGDYPVTATPTNGGDITINFAATSDGGAIRFQSTSS